MVSKKINKFITQSLLKVFKKSNRVKSFIFLIVVYLVDKYFGINLFKIMSKVLFLIEYIHFKNTSKKQKQPK